MGFALALAVTLLVGACSRMNDLPQPTLLEHGTHSAVTTREIYVIRNRGEWEALWTRHRADVVGVDAKPPVVDFSRQIVVAAFAGNFPTGGYSLEILPTSLADGCIIVRVRLVRPPADAILTQAFTQPYVFATLPRTPQQVSVAIVEAE